MLERVLAHGGMGKVYVARQEGAGRQVAIKVVLTDAEELSADALQRFELEAQAVARLKHAGIVKVIQFGLHRGLPFLAMDLIEGESLKARIGRSEPYGPRPAAQLLAALARAIQHAHDQGILHRDLKPANVLLDSEGRARITDFGLARDMLETRERLTRTGQMMGTPAYMPPEQADGDLPNIGPRSDVYSLGAILYAVLTGRPPFVGENALNIVYKVLTQEVAPPNTDPALRAICLVCLAKRPKQRYASAELLADDLDRYLRGEPVLARPPHAPLGEAPRRAICVARPRLDTGGRSRGLEARARRRGHQEDGVGRRHPESRHRGRSLVGQETPAAQRAS